MSEEIRAEHTEENDWEIHVDRAEAQPVNILGLEVASSAGVEVDYVSLQYRDAGGVPVYSMEIPLHDRTIDSVLIRDERATFISLHGEDPTHMFVRPEDWDEIEDLASSMVRASEEPAMARPWTSIAVNAGAMLNEATLRQAVNGNFYGDNTRIRRFQEPARDPEPSGQIEGAFRRDGDLTQEQWLYPEGIVSMAGGNGCRTIMQLESVMAHGASDPHAQVILRIPEMHVTVTTHNVPVPAINWRNQRDVDSYYRAMRRRVFKHVTAYLRAEFERHKRANPTAQRDEVIPF